MSDDNIKVTLPILMWLTSYQQTFSDKRAKARRNIGYVLYKALHTTESKMLVKLEWQLALLQSTIRHLFLCYLEKVLKVYRGGVERLSGFRVILAIPIVATSLDIEYNLWYQI